MKCSKCRHENPVRARFCARCGSPFSDEERQAAWDRTIYGKLDKLKEAKGWITLSKITSNPVFRILFLAAIILFGVMSGRNRGSDMMILESPQYSVYYNSHSKDWFLKTGEDSVEVGLYLPGEPDSVTVRYVSEDGTVRKEEDFSVSDEIVLAKDPSTVYLVSGNYGSSTKTLSLMVVGDEWEG